MAGNSFQNVTLAQLSGDGIVYQGVFRYLLYRSSKFFAIWGLNVLEGACGKTPQDIVMEAIEAVMGPNSPFDPSSGSLVSYLVLSQIRGRVANLAKKAAVRQEQVTGDQEERDNSESTGGEPTLVDHAKLVIDRAMQAVQGDTDAENILLGRIEGMKREEIMEMFELDSARYSNAYRRLKSKMDTLAAQGLKRFLL
jgi:DNA-directed RNA polymerase specialized sigma24 family protein